MILLTVLINRMLIDLSTTTSLFSYVTESNSIQELKKHQHVCARKHHITQQMFFHTLKSLLYTPPSTRKKKERKNSTHNKAPYYQSQYIIHTSFFGVVINKHSKYQCCPNKCQPRIVPKYFQTRPEQRQYLRR